MNISFICAGRVKEEWFRAAFDEYAKRLGAYGKVKLTEIPETRLPEKPSRKEIDAALGKESEAIINALPKDAAVIAMCVEGKEMSSEQLAARIKDIDAAGRSGIAVITGGSCGLHENVKKAADIRLSMSPMTFPHSLARVMAVEQIYRAFSINAGGRYHK